MSHDDRIADLEREKYEKVWAHEEYRKFSPGEQEQAYFAELMLKNGGTSVIDYGCGEGFSVQYFQDRGFKAVGIEHAKNAPRAAGIQVLGACLWDLPFGLTSDNAFCCDVMEHIPEIKVGAVLHQIRLNTRLLALFRISTVEDHFGPKLINKPLHLTVRNANWWLEKLLEHWPTVIMKDSERRSYATFICSASSPFRKVESGSTH